MKTAQEMAAFTKANNEEPTQIIQIEKAIEVAAKKGLYSCFVYFSINIDVRKKITELGYIVDPELQDRDGVLTKISWK